MRIVVAMDSFKGSLSSPEAGNAVRKGILKADPTAVVDVLPLADGGEGTVDALISCMGGDRNVQRGRSSAGAGESKRSAIYYDVWCR